MEHKLLVLCDPEEDYAHHMAEFLCKRKEAVWEVMVYTKPEELHYLEKNIEVLLIAESAYGEFVKELSVRLPILLNESGVIRVNNLINIDKYQEAEKVHQMIWSKYMELEQDAMPMLKDSRQTKFIGMFTPVRRCLQTTFALTYGQLLAEKGATLYLSFEYFGTPPEWEEGAQDGVSRLLYFLSEEKGFEIQRKLLTKKIGELDYISPMVNGQNLLLVSSGDWMRLLHKIAESGEYEYIILDLSESVQGLFEILQMCWKVYTIVKEDVAAKNKILQYEHLLAMQKMEDVRGKTSRCILPMFHKLPPSMEQYTKGELAEYVKELLYREVV